LIDDILKYGEKTIQISVYTEKQANYSIFLVYEDDGVENSVENKKGFLKEVSEKELALGCS
jgi:hypothetical protein